MKKYIYLLIILLAGVSCEPDILKEKPQGLLSPDVFFESDQVEQAVDNLSKEFADVWGNAAHVAPFIGGDDLTAHWGLNKQHFREIDLFAPTSVNDRLKLWWDNMFRTIRGANAIIDKVEGSSVSDEQKKDMLGNAYFYRAISYSFLTRIFGEVPLITTFSTGVDLNIGKSSVADIYEVILSDLKQAEELLPEKRPEKAADLGGYPGAKPCKGTVKALMSQVYLTMSGWPLKETSNYVLAAQKAKEVIDNATVYGYELIPNCADLWTWANNYTNKEVVFGLYYSFSGRQNMACPLPSKPLEYYHPKVTWAQGWCDYYAEISFFNRFPEGPRKDATYQTIIPVIKKGDLSWDDPQTQVQHPFFKKLQDDHPESSWIGARTQQIIRYAEVLLNYAEAQAMADGVPNAQAYDCVNQIRRRAGLNDLPAGLSAEDFRDAVVEERGWEFAGGESASRWFDLIRLERVEDATKLRSEKENPLINFPTHDNYWMPIPESEISLNPNLR